MDFAASVITIVSTTLTVARHIKDLVQSVRQRHEKAKELEHRLDTLTAILAEAGSLYENDNHSNSSRGRLLRNLVKQVVDRCGIDLDKFRIELEKLVDHGNWLSATWKEQRAGPALAKIEHSLSSHHDRLSMLVQLIQGHQLNRIEEMLQTLTKDTNTSPAATANGNQLAESDPMISELASLIRDGEAETLVGEEELGSRGDQECNINGISLLQAIEDGDHGAFESLLHDGATSLKEKDGNERNPLLLAAHLGRAGMVKMLLNSDNNTKDQNCACIQVPWDESAQGGHDSIGEDSVTHHRELNLNATDCLGRTVLHYCAEFDWCDKVRVLLEHGAYVNARDKGDFPPAYFAAKCRKYDAVKLLLSNGATSDFKRPPLTSQEIEKLLDESSNGSQSAPKPRSRPQPSKNRSMSTPPRQRNLTSIMRRWSSAMD
ncbi:MAG: hypothetical protein Q9216_004308 [Gyalolechia sp. 2 TL-2023]